MSLTSSVPQGLVERIKAAEGFRSLPYRDSLGYWTIGYGKLLSTDKTLLFNEALTLAGGPWSIEKATEAIKDSLAYCEVTLIETFPWFHALESVRHECFIELCYNMGINRLSGFTNLLKAAENGQWVRAAIELMDSLYAKQVGARAKRIAIALGTGVV